MLTFPWLSGGPHLFALGVGHKPEPVPAMGRAGTASWQYCRRNGVTFAFQVMSGFVQPFMGNRGRNLFSKDDWRLALANEPEPYWPEVALVGLATLLSGGTERLAGATSGPNRSVVWPSCLPEREGPSSDSGEEVTLDISAEVIGLHLRYGTRIHVASG